jgi:hypothetical protein
MKCALLLAAGVAVLASVSHSPAQADGPAVSYDQIEVGLSAQSTPPPVDGFSADLARIKPPAGDAAMPHMGMDPGAMAVSAVPLIGGFLAGGMAAAQMKKMKAAMADRIAAMQQAAVLRQTTRFAHVIRWNGFERREELDDVVIDRPDRNLRYHLFTQMQAFYTEPLQTVTASTEIGTPVSATLHDSHANEVTALQTPLKIVYHPTLNGPDLALSESLLAPATDTTVALDIASDLVPPGYTLGETQPTVASTSTYRFIAAGDQSSVHFVERANFATVDNPDPALFDVPAGYRLMQPGSGMSPMSFPEMGVLH